MLDELPFIGDWARERSLGAGGFGAVVLWRNKKTSQAVAVKKCSLLSTNDSITDRQKERWDYEVQLMTTKIECANIVKTIQIDGAFREGLLKHNPSKLAILPMEYCEGGDLRRVLNKKSNCSGLSEKEVREILRALRNAISYLHDQKITHRDIKPENIVLKHDGSSKDIVYKITDLGYAKQLDRQSLQASLVGTMEYLAPELLHSDKYSCSVDYWSLGIIGFEICCGTRPFLPHASMARWMLTVKNKKSQHICITEDNAETFHYNSEMCPETKIYGSLKQMLERWLTLALEWNPKQRGYVFEVRNFTPNSSFKGTAVNNGGNKSPTSKNVSFSGREEPASPAPAHAGPTQTLRIFTYLDELLNRKILTLFSLSQYNFLSFDVTDVRLTVNELRTMITSSCGGSVLAEEWEFILPFSHHLEEVQNDTKLVDLYVEDEYEKPMVYVAKRGAILDRLVKPVIPQLIVDVFENPVNPLRFHIVKQFANNSYYFLRNEQRLYTVALDGIKNYGLQLNHEVTMHKGRLNQLSEQVFELKGIVKFFGNNLKVAASAGMIVADLQSGHQKLHVNVIKLVDAARKIRTRYESVLKRSVEVVKHKLFEMDPKELYQTNALNDQIDLIRHQLMEKKVTDKTHAGLVKLLYNCLKERDICLGEAEFLHLQQFLLDLKKESTEIFKTIDKALQQTAKYKVDVQSLNDQYQVLVMAINQQRRTIVNGGGVEATVPSVIDFHIGASCHSSQTNTGSAENGSAMPETRSLIDENHTLLEALGALLGLAPSSEL